MGASSVTGVSGQGSVSGSQKGSEHMSLSVHNLIGPHVFAAGKVTLSGTTGTVYVPAPTSGAVGDYQVMLSSTTSTLAYNSTALATVADSNEWSFGVTASNNAVVHWMLVKSGK